MTTCLTHCVVAACAYGCEFLFATGRYCRASRQKLDIKTCDGVDLQGSQDMMCWRMLPHLESTRPPIAKLSYHC